MTTNVNRNWVSWQSKFHKLLTHPALVRKALLRACAPVLSYESRLFASVGDRPHYGYCLLKAARLALSLGYKRMSVIEFGVAGGNGLVSLESHAIEVERLTGVTVEIYGFDTAEGLPAPTDYRDLPYHWKAGFFSMDYEALTKRLTRAKLVIGDVAETVKTFTRDYNPAPIGAVMHDLDYYTSTIASFAIFDSPSQFRLPRIFNYFDDIIDHDVELYNEYTGELLAINDYNASHPHQKITQIRSFKGKLRYQWHEQIYVQHDFDHPQYCTLVSESDQNLPLLK
jgi:hypothetical protein